MERKRAERSGINIIVAEVRVRPQEVWGWKNNGR